MNFQPPIGPAKASGSRANRAAAAGPNGRGGQRAKSAGGVAKRPDLNELDARCTGIRNAGCWAGLALDKVESRKLPQRIALYRDGDGDSEPQAAGRAQRLGCGVRLGARVCVCGWVGGGGGERAEQVAHVSLSEGLFEPLSIGLKKINKRYDILVTRACVLDLSEGELTRQLPTGLLVSVSWSVRTPVARPRTDHSFEHNNTHTTNITHHS
jgi:hypothetical protein